MPDLVFREYLPVMLNLCFSYHLNSPFTTIYLKCSNARNSVTDRANSRSEIRSLQARLKECIFYSFFFFFAGGGRYM